MSSIEDCNHVRLFYASITIDFGTIMIFNAYREMHVYVSSYTDKLWIITIILCFS